MNKLYFEKQIANASEEFNNSFDSEEFACPVMYGVLMSLLQTVRDLYVIDRDKCDKFFNHLEDCFKNDLPIDQLQLNEVLK